MTDAELEAVYGAVRVAAFMRGDLVSPIERLAESVAELRAAGLSRYEAMNYFRRYRAEEHCPCQACKELLRMLRVMWPEEATP